MSCNDAECSSFTKSFWDGYLQCQLYRRPGHVYTMHCPYKDHEICKCPSESWSNCDDFTNSIKSWKQSLEFYIYTYKPHVWDDIISSTTIIHPDSILSPCPPFFREAPSKLDPLENSHAHQRSIPMVPGVVDCRKGWIPNGWNTFWNKSVSIHVLNRDILEYPWEIFFHWVLQRPDGSKSVTTPLTESSGTTLEQIHTRIVCWGPGTRTQNLSIEVGKIPFPFRPAWRPWCFCLTRKSWKPNFKQTKTCNLT